MIIFRCDSCGATFDDGIDAGHHAMNTGHRVEYADTDALVARSDANALDALTQALDR